MASSPRTTWGSGTSWSAGARVKVRMYRGLLGDCFLLRFRRQGGDAFVLIDCGMFQGMTREADHMRAIVADIARTCGFHLDAVIITHEHWDHICGFLHAADLFDEIRIDALWLAWTEDPADADAQALRNAHRAALALLGDVAPQLAHREVVESVLGFFGAREGAAGSGTILDAMKSRAAQVHYLSPGQAPLALAGVEGLAVHVLGPPRDRRLLRRSDPTRSGREVYDFAGGADGDRLFLAAGLAPDDAADAIEIAMPFDRKHRTDIAALRAHPHPSSPVPEWARALAETYGHPDEAWRRVDGDWLDAFEALALRLDSDTNNTSLALAFALGMDGGKPGDVLLFPGDAQVGNWLSWADYAPPGQTRADHPDAITRDRLLARTVLYKVGHHGSHNATLRAEGLEKMTHPDLVALLPVEEAFARNARSWNMPFPALYERLLQRCGGNVLRSDRSVSQVRAEKQQIAYARASRAFDTAEDAADELYVELTL